MGRVYAGILGSISFGVVVARGLIDGDSVAAALYAAPLALFAFATIGYVIGSIADRTIVEAVKAQLHAQLRAEEAPQTAVTTGINPASGAGQPT